MTMTTALPSPIPVPKYVSQCAAAFVELCRYGTHELNADSEDCVHHFHSHCEPSVSLFDYLRRIEAEVRCGEDGFLIALILIGRACNDRRPSKVLLPSILTAHRLFLTALRVATKMHHDIHRSNRAFARVGGICNAELNHLEWLFLNRLGFNALVHPEELESVRSALHLASGLGTNLIARLLVNAMGLEVASRARRPLPDLGLHDTAPSPTAPPLSSVSGGGRVAVRKLRADRFSCESTPSPSHALTSVTPLRFPSAAAGVDRLASVHSSQLFASQSFVSPEASP